MIAGVPVENMKVRWDGGFISMNATLSQAAYHGALVAN
jgi:hypothetical protein